MKTLVKVGDKWDIRFDSIKKIINDSNVLDDRKYDEIKKFVISSAIDNKKFMNDFIKICKNDIYPRYGFLVMVKEGDTSLYIDVTPNIVKEALKSKSSKLKRWQRRAMEEITIATSPIYIRFKYENKEIKNGITYLKLMNVLRSPQNKIREMIDKNEFLGMSGEEFYMLIFDNYINNYHFQTESKVAYELDEEDIKLINENIELIKYKYEPNFSKDKPFEESRNIVDDFKLNDVLKRQILQNIPSDYNELQKAYFIYKRLCQKFSYDEDYFYYAYKVKEDEYIKPPVIDHSDISRLNIISVNSDVICTEITMLFAKFLDLLNISYRITDYHDHTNIDYKDSHMKVVFKIQDATFEADAAHGLYSSDLSIEKTYGLVRHFKPLGPLPERVRDDISKELLEVDKYFKNFESRLEFEDAKEIYESMYKKKENISLEEKVQVLIDMIDKVNLKYMDMFDWVRDTRKRIFAGDDRQFCNIEFIINKKPVKEDKTYELAMVVMYNQDNIANLETNKYIVLTSDGNKEYLTYEEIKKRFEDNIYDFTDKDRKDIYFKLMEESNENGYSGFTK